MNEILITRNNYDINKDIKSVIVWGRHIANRPLFTVAIPAYKRGNLLKEAIFSILNQKDSPSFEIVITDDELKENGEESEAMKAVKEINDDRVILYHNEQNLGLAGNWNRCMELSKSEFVCALDDDDFLEETYFSEAYKILTTHPNIDMLGTKWRYCDQRRNPPKSNNDLRRRMHLFAKHSKRIEAHIKGKLTKVDKYLVYPHIVLLLSGSIIRRSSAIALGGFNNDWYPSMDYAFLANATLNLNVYVYNKSLCVSRLLSNTSAKPDSVKRFCTSDFIIHELMIKMYPPLLRPFFALANRVMVHYQLLGLNKSWGTSIRYEEIAAELQIGKFYTSKFAKFIYFIFIRFLSLYKMRIKYRNTKSI